MCYHLSQKAKGDNASLPNQNPYPQIYRQFPPIHTLMHTHSLLSFLLPLQCLSVSLSPVGIIYHYIQQTEASQLLCPGNACSHAAIKAKRHPLPPAPMGAWQQRGKESRGKEEEEGTVREGYKQGDQEGRGR